MSPRHFLIVFLAVCSCVLAAPLKATDLKNALKIVRQNSLDPEIYRRQVLAARFESQKADSAFDTTFSLESTYVDDQEPSQSAFSGDQRQVDQHALTLSKMFASGTRFETEFSYKRTRLEFPDATTTPVNPAAASASSSFEKNPEHLSKVKLTLSQPFLKGWGAKQVELEKQLTNYNSIPPIYQNRINQQVLQMQTEKLYWQLAVLREQINIGQKLYQLSEENLRLTKLRAKVGRSDQVDVAAAESQLVRQSGLILNLQLASKRIEQQITYLLYPNGTSSPLNIVVPRLTRSPLPSPGKTFTALLKKALKQRQDLELLKSSQQPIDLKLKLAREIDRPSLNGFVSGAYSGLDQNPEKSTDDLSTGDHPTVSVGLMFSMKLGRTAYHSTRRSAAEQRAELNTKVSHLQNEIKRDLVLALEDYQSARQQFSQANIQISTLNRQIRAEQKRVEQARSSEVVVIRYQMEVLSTENNKAAALGNERMSEADLRFLTHSYPVLAETYLR